MQYNQSKPYKIAMFVLNNSATNLPLFLFSYYMYYTQNILGLSGIIVGIIATSMRIFDGITDPIIGFFIDKTNGKFGKFRPFMLIGNLIITLSTLIIFNTPSWLSESGKYFWTTGFYILYIIGYTFQTACTKGGQVILTNDPKQRPLFSIFDTIYNTFIFTGGIYILMNIIAPRFKNGLVNPKLWLYFSTIIAISSSICTIFAIFGIWEKDKPEYFNFKSEEKLKFKDYFEIIKNNRAIQMLIIAASTDKLASTAMNVAAVYLFSNTLLNSKLQGTFSAITAIPIVIMGITGLYFARKFGLKRIFVITTWLGMFSTIIMYFIGLNKGNVILFLIFMFLQKGFAAVSTPIVTPMIADVTDYEKFRTGRFVPGMMGTLFSFVDKLISSLSTTIVGLCLAYAGVSKSIILPNTFISLKFDQAILFAYCGLPIFGYIASLIGMKYYELDKEKMEAIQKQLSKKNTIPIKNINEDKNIFISEQEILEY